MYRLQTLAKSHEQTLYVSRTVPEHEFAAWQGPFLCGFFPRESARIDDVLEKANATVQEDIELLNGVECVVVEAKTGKGSYKVWFAPALRHCVLKFVRIQTENELMRRDETAHRPRSADGREAGQPDYPIGATLTLDNVRAEQFGEVWIPISGTLTEEIIYRSGKRTLVTTSAERRKVELHPDTRGVSFAPAIRDGTRARFLDRPNSIPNEWRAIPREDKEMTARLRAIVGDRRFTTDAGELSILALARGPAMFLALVGGIFALQWLWLWARTRRKQIPPV